jgi:exosortase/archaeosortase family protein
MSWVGRGGNAVPARTSDWIRASFALGLLRAVRQSVSRDQFFTGLFILALVNGLAARATQGSSHLDLSALAAAALSVSAVVWFACFAALSLVLRKSGDEAVKTVDGLVGFAVLFLVAVPFKELSWFALAALALYVFWISEAGSTIRRGALIFLAITVPMCWGPLVLHAFAQPFLWTDALFVSNLIGTERTGNLVKFADGSGYFQIFPACSSYHNMSLAFLAWISVSQFVERKWSPQDLVWCLLAALSVLAVNVTRIGLIGLYRDHFETIHGPFGAAIADTVSLSLILAICLLGVRREIFARP